jgi:nucleoside-diphosphate-sugar epimerase
MDPDLTDHSALPDRIASEAVLDELLTRPRAELISAIHQFQSPLLVLGASGKMGPSLCLLARRASEAAGSQLRIVAASRFSDPRSRAWLEKHGIETLGCDLLDRQDVERLPDSANIIYLVGLKFGTQRTPWQTWAVNTIVPSNVAQRFPSSRIVALSTGNVYPFVPFKSGGATEETVPAPIGEYANAALARERLLEYHSRKTGTPVVLLRLNYAVELRYGVLLDLAERVWKEEPIDLTSGYLNCIWQGDANEFVLRAMALAATPPLVFNLTGQSVLAVRELAQQFGSRMGRKVRILGTEPETALLSNPNRLCEQLGTPGTPLSRCIEWIAQWVMEGGTTFGKPTHFGERSGQY